MFMLALVECRSRRPSEVVLCAFCWTYIHVLSQYVFSGNCLFHDINKRQYFTPWTDQICFSADKLPNLFCWDEVSKFLQSNLWRFSWFLWDTTITMELCNRTCWHLKGRCLHKNWIARANKYYCRCEWLSMVFNKVKTEEDYSLLVFLSHQRVYVECLSSD